MNTTECVLSIYGTQHFKDHTYPFFWFTGATMFGFTCAGSPTNQLAQAILW